ncbi:MULTISPECIES: helix-turn-helix domain-containing protein [Bacillota]|uniref:Transposase n=2 Tax=Companilactobacillus TaxID=2767879 RepID=A0A2K9HPU8_9LACO|nr:MULTISPECIES: helix-turn-helix domain-containing protein [Bacillota]MCL1563613.1 helix-turn-helix domain-containing protein [Parasaccharibacter sp. TMW 2.1886]AUI70764.1 transposase [Companilactobacillus alimentarius DSM 20249]AUI70774.1 transposase [Companilactobacillus alimentarius DSM 20249]AUI70849.1 transposase [Companilactobacillus alimentarius DSM 20249]AUI71304.1 transposase [Companilactobacillus alimentarius DSM 20249]
MVKYSSKLKAEVVGEYLQGRTSMQSLSEKHNLPKRQVSFWIQKYRLSGVDSLKRKKTKRSFSAEFKIDVINYYQTHDETLAEVSARFDVNKCQISSWRTAFNKHGIEALKSHPKGRKSKVKNDKKKLRHLINKNELDQLREELAKKNQELYDTKLENDILKKSMTLFGTSKDAKKHK